VCIVHAELLGIMCVSVGEDNECALSLLVSLVSPGRYSSPPLRVRRLRLSSDYPGIVSTWDAVVDLRLLR